LFKAGRVSSGGTFQYASEWDGSELIPVSAGLTQSFGWFAAEPYLLLEDDATRFREFWSMFDAVHSRREIEGSIRRFGFAADRTRADDEIVDLMIAAESLLMQRGDEKYRGEIRFRLSVRAASLLADTPEQRLSAFRFMRRAYDARSKIVHGGTLSESHLVGLDGSQLSVDGFADSLEDAVRKALHKAMDRLASGEGFPPDWDSLMFALPEEVASESR